MKTGSPNLLPLLRSKAQAEVLTWLVLHPQERWSISELAARTRTSPATAMREVNRLVEAGLVSSSRQGNQRMVAMRTDHALFAPLERLITLAFCPRPVLEELLADVERLEDAYIYGSWAARYLGKPGEVPRDVDVLLVGDVSGQLIDEIARVAEERLGREVNVRQIRPPRWHEPDDPDPFVKTVRSRPMVALDLGGAA
jgi:DNA-binding transcriptional ArsR family regulator